MPKQPKTEQPVEAESQDNSSEIAPTHSDPSYLHQVFPNSETVFDRKQEPIADIKNDCLVALDANVLLLPYQMNKVSLQEVGKVYATLNQAGRLLIPAQAAREFAVNRASKVGDIVSHLRRESSTLRKPLTEKIGFLENEQAYNDVKDIASKIEVLQKEFRKKVAAIAEGLSAEIGNDPVSLIYSDMKTSIKELPWGDDEKKELDADLANRAKYKIPPGYKDGKKIDGGPGDLVIWKTILAEGKSRDKHCISVTAEEKPDWWVRNHGAFQPRIELIEEYRKATRDRTIHVIVLSKLLELFDVADDTVLNVRKVEQANSALAVLAGSSRADSSSSHYTFAVGVSPEQANDLAILRDTLTLEIAEKDEEIARWQTIESTPITEAQIQLLSNKQEELRKKVGWIDRQLKLTPPTRRGAPT
jgi:hypothetical protein